MTIRHPFAVASLAILAGCAGTPSAARRDVTVVDMNRQVYRSSDVGIRADYKAPRDSVFNALAQAYADAGVAPDLVDTRESIVSRKQIRIPITFMGTRASMIFACGENAVGVSLAEQGQLYASVRSQIVGDFDHPTVQTLVQAWAIPEGGSASSAVHCGSLGWLEERIHRRVAERLAAR